MNIVDTLNKHQRTILILILITLLFTFVVMAWPYLLDNFDSSLTDQRAFLGVGLDIRNFEHLTDGNRHPFLPLILSTFASHEWTYFTSAKLLNLGFSLILFVVIFYLGYKLFGAEVGLVAAILTVFNKSLPEVFTKVSAEPLLVLFCFVSLYFLYLAIQQQKDKFYLLAGFFVGLAYLTKGTGQVLFLAMVGILLLLTVLSPQRRFQPLAFFLLAYFLTISPLLIYNYFTWGDPFYNVNTSEVMWYSSFEEVYKKSGRENLIGFLQTTGLNELLGRLTYGVQMVIFKFFDVFLFSPVTLVVALVSLVNLLIIKISRQKPQPVFNINRRLALIPVVVGLCWFAFFAWFMAISTSDRHFLPILPLANMLIAIFFVYTMKNVGYFSAIQKRLPIIAAVLVMVICAVFITQSVLHLKSYSTLNPFLSDVENNAPFDELIAGLKQMDPTMTVVTGPSYLVPYWHIKETDVKILKIPEETKTIDELLAYMQSVKTRVLIVDSGTILHRDFLKEFFEPKNEDTYSKFKYIRPLPSQLELMADYKCGPSPIMIFTYKPSPN